MEKGYFYQHLHEAILLNLARRDYYIQATAGKAQRVSRLLVGAERSLLWTAQRLDGRARPFIDQGIPIIQNDFVSMELVKPKETPPTYTQVAPRLARLLARDTLRAVRRNAIGAVRAHDYDTVVMETLNALIAIEKLEEETRAHFAMSKHQLESLGFAALHAPHYLQQSGGATRRLSRIFVGIQLGAVDQGLQIDCAAQACHALGAGIIVNDVPYIPFIDQFQQGK